MLRCVVLGGLVILGTATAAVAADPVPLSPEEGWQFTAAPYIWAAGVKGQEAVFGAPEVDVDESFIDLLQTLDVGFMGALEARYDRFSLTTDVMWAKAGDHAKLSTGGGVDLNTQSWTVTGLAGYSIIQEPEGNLDIVAGARLWAIDNDLDLSGPLAGDAHFQDNEAWVDPVFGVKGRIALTDTVFLTGYGLLGGFGAGSDFMWDGFGAIGYQFTDKFSAIAGFRGLGVDFKDGHFTYDITQTGPVIGGEIKF